MEQPEGYDEASTQTEWGLYRGYEIHHAHQMLRIPMETTVAQWSDVDLLEVPDLETDIGDAVGTLLLAAQQAGFDPREICEQELDYVGQVGDDIEEEMAEKKIRMPDSSDE
ncbi:hypothetical protein D9V37_16420 [Nocardioides mangrovicus]|uniref:Uncharacterized protein n=1 Tax=Nocardioides mangrovicus TaxID=2478913 RepID=A0A3L8P036_9ACTN|nr:hypothetical protein [Nocardioides mangrovicus]RLV47728.1 hypothetical protein D9V37_16420 [Nocardioides mangrovicus]